MLLCCPLFCSDGGILEEVDASTQPVVIIIAGQESMLQDVGGFGLAGAVVSIYGQRIVHNCMISLCSKYMRWQSIDSYSGYRFGIVFDEFTQVVERKLLEKG